MYIAPYSSQKFKYFVSKNVRALHEDDKFQGVSPTASIDILTADPPGDATYPSVSPLRSTHRHPSPPELSVRYAE